MPHVLVGEITNHTHHLETAEIHEIVEAWALANGGPQVFGSLENVHAAPADDPKLLKRATRAWRDGEGTPHDFTQHVGGKMHWFGFQARDPSGSAGAGAEG